MRRTVTATAQKSIPRLANAVFSDSRHSFLTERTRYDTRPVKGALMLAPASCHPQLGFGEIPSYRYPGCCLLLPFYSLPQTGPFNSFDRPMLIPTLRLRGPVRLRASGRIIESSTAASLLQSPHSLTHPSSGLFLSSSSSALVLSLHAGTGGANRQ